MKNQYVYVLRTCDKDGKSYNDFQWPTHGNVECSDWIPNKACGNGLHGWLWGEGDGSCGHFMKADCRFLVVKVKSDDVIELNGKVKFPRGEVVFYGDSQGAIDVLKKNLPESKQGNWICICGTATAGYCGTAIAGYCGTATAGDRGTATAGDRGTAIVGIGGTATAGVSGTATAGDRGMATAGDRGTATAGYCGRAIAGYSGTATAGDGGTATAGYGGTATAGNGGTAIAGHNGTAAAGKNGILMIGWFDMKENRHYVSVGHVGEDGIEEGELYHVENKKLIKGDSAEAKKAREYAASISSIKPIDQP